ncbi:MAG: enoyl-ACP reductase [Planctomycetota bacterium]|jgi:enoyl-[acyl-carrier protein] reductase I
MDFLGLQGRRIVVLGVANKKSVAYFIGRTLQDAGAEVVYVVRSDKRREEVSKLFPGASILVCDVERQDEIDRVCSQLKSEGQPIAGFVHSIAFADYSEGMKPFHQTTRRQFLQAIDISCFSLIALSEGLRDQFTPDASVVTISISTTRMASESYGFMAPVKAALDSSLAFLAKSFSSFSRVRFNAVGAGLLKTSASAGIPGYVDAYLFAERAIPRKQGLTTQEVANVAAFLISPRSSGINAQTLIVDAGMSINYFDREIIARQEP